MSLPLPVRQLERLAAANIRPVAVPGIQGYYVFERGGFAALVQRTESGFGEIGGAGLVTSEGLAVLVWRGKQPFFVRKGLEWPATAEEVDRLRCFARELADALAPDASEPGA